MAINFLNTVAVDENVLFVDTVNDRVGIGTASPGAKLHVDGTAIFDTQTGAQPFYITRDGATDQALKIYVDDSAAIFESIQDEDADNYGAFQFILDAGVTEPYFDVRKGTALANTLFRVDGNGNVGIGTVTPGAKLHVESTVATGANFILETTHTGGIPLLDLKGAHSAQLRYKDELDVIQGRIDFGDSGTFNFIDVPNNNSTLYLKTGGNVGIGTTLPDFKLDVDGTFGVSDLPFNTDSVSVLVADETIGADLVTNGDFATNTDWTLTANVAISGGKLNFTNATTNTHYANQVISAPVGSVYKITLEVSNLGSGESIKIRFPFQDTSINANGTYTIVGEGTTANAFRITPASATATFSIDNVSVKQITSASNQIQKRELGTGAFGPTPVGAYLPLAGGTMTGTNGVVLPDNFNLKIGTGSDLQIYHSGTESKINNDVGNLSITNFANDSDIIFSSDNGSGSTTPYLVLDGSTTHAYFSNPGNVGIGTTSPGAKLEIEGDATADDTAQLIVASGGVDNNAIIHFTDDDGGQVNAIGALEGNMLTFASQNEMIFKTGTSSILGNANTKMTIDTNGDVGIGTASPQSKLQVAGGIQMADDPDTASADKVGTMRYRTGTEYVEVTGAELVTNGDFATDSNWTKETGWSIGSGAASYNGSANNNAIYQSPGLTSGSTYRLSFSVVNYVSGTLIGNLSNGSTTGGTGNITANGDYSFNITAAGVLCIFRSTSSFNGSIDNVSVIEVTAEDASYADMCMQTGASTYEWVNIVRNTY